jgi:hypothetical protein
MAMAMITTLTLEPSSATSAMASRIDGIAMMPSISRMTMASTRGK